MVARNKRRPSQTREAEKFGDAISGAARLRSLDSPITASNLVDPKKQAPHAPRGKRQLALYRNLGVSLHFSASCCVVIYYHHTTALTRDTATMARLRSLLQQVCSVLLLLAVGSNALKLDIQAGNGHDKTSRRCIRNFVAKDMLVVVTAIVDGYRGDGMQLNMHVSVGEDGTWVLKRYGLDGH